jgi:small-conductance mechanosensitive channel
MLPNRTRRVRRTPRQRRRLPRARQRRRGGADRQTAARGSLRHFRQATILAVAITAFLLMLFAPDELAFGQELDGEAPPAVEAPATPAAEQTRPDEVVPAAAEEARRTLEELWISFLSQLPKGVVALAILLLAWLISRLIRPILRGALRQWERANAVTALVGIGVWVIATIIALSVIAGDIRTLVGSVGILGLALSWALQTPIESFTGWLMNSFKSYYRIGDRVAVGEVFGDVYSIDFLTTTVWEIGSPHREGFVRAEQPTGRLITFPNSEVLAGSIVNLTRDFPFVWDEHRFAISDGSDLDYAMEVAMKVARSIVGEQMVEPAGQYELVLQSMRLESAVPREPQVFISSEDMWINLSIRYLVPARERRIWASRLVAAISREFNSDEHRGKIAPAWERRRVQLIDRSGQPLDPPSDGIDRER